MAKNAPGKHYRQGVTLTEMVRRFPTDEAAEKWFTETRWPAGPTCPKCGSNNIHSGTRHKTMPYRCRTCRKYFSVKTGTVLEGTKLGFQTWLLASYLLTTGLKGQASMKLHRDLGITQKTAWHLAHRIRETWPNLAKQKFNGPAEIDETYMGGKERNKHGDKKLKAGRGGVGKSIVIGAKDRETNNMTASVIGNTDKKTLHGFIEKNVSGDSTVYTDDFTSYGGLPFKHEKVNHTKGEYVKGEAHTNGIEGFWAMLKRGHKGVYHKMSEKHLQRYVNEFAGRHNDRRSDTVDQMARIMRGMIGKKLRYSDLIG